MERTDTIALVTGANRGIGLEVVRQLAQRGMRVVLGARNLAQGEMAAQAANKMLAADSLDAILAAGEKAGLGAKDIIGQALTIHSVDWAESSDRFDAPFGVFAVVHSTDTQDADTVWTTGAGNLVSALRAMELGGHFPVTLRVAKRTTGNGELFYFTK